MKHSVFNRTGPGRVAITAALVLFCQGHAWAKCDDGWLSIDENRDGDLLTVTARNVAEFPLTYSVKIRLRSESGEPQSGHARRTSGILEGRQSERLMTLPFKEEDGADRISISCTWTIGDRDATHDDNYLYLLPYARGKSYRVIQGFNSRFSHSGVEQFAVDFKMDVGTPVHAARGGVVARVEESNDKGCWQDGCGQYANFIVIMHDDGTTGEYYHLQKNGALVEVGERVEAGQKIGLSGNTGHTTLPHLHFAVYKATWRALPQSVPITFVSADGVVVDPRRGHRYLAVSSQRVGG
jgi:murein DD-endopeptidase MepM/ murein hydrolase activator NlpD